MAEKKDAKPEEKKKPVDVMLILQILFAVVNIGVVGAGAYLTYISTLGYHHPTITEIQLAAEENAKKGQVDLSSTLQPLIYTMDKFTVNLDGDPMRGDPQRTIQLEVNIEMLNRDGFEEVMDVDNRAKARDKILSLLNSKTFPDVESIQGKLFLKDQIAGEINNILHQGIVKDVYFSHFVVH